MNPALSQVLASTSSVLCSTSDDLVTTTFRVVLIGHVVHLLEASALEVRAGIQWLYFLNSPFSLLQHILVDQS